MSETGSLDRMKAAAERRKKGLDECGPTVSGRVEGTRVNPDSLIDELLKNTKLEQLEESAESMYLARISICLPPPPPPPHSHVQYFHLQRPASNCTLLEMVRRL